MLGHDERDVLVIDYRQLSHGLIEFIDQPTITWNVFGVQQLARWRILRNMQYTQTIKQTLIHKTVSYNSQNMQNQRHIYWLLYYCYCILYKG